jgi:hypothetical protein
VERAGEGQRKRTRASAGLKATLGSSQSRWWHRQSGSGGERRRSATASSCWRLGQRRGALGEGQQEGGEAVGELGGDAWRPGEAGGTRAARHSASGGTAAQQRGSRGRRKGGGRRGLSCELQKLHGPHCNTKFPTVLKLK